MTGSCDLSVVIPAYDEAGDIVEAVRRVSATLPSLGGTSEILVVDDGSRDATVSLARDALRECGVAGSVIQLPRNRGKGAAVKAGMLAAHGRFRLFLDADLSVEPSYLEGALELLQEADVVVASRRMAESRLVRRQPLVREVLGTIYRTGASLLFVPGVSDLTCGLKGFTERAAEGLFGLSRVERFGFDVEVLYLARRLGFTIREMPVAWKDDPDTRVRVLADSVRSLVELAAIPANAWLGRYAAAARPSQRPLAAVAPEVRR